MNKNLQKLLLAALLAPASACATEIRTPWTANNGPLRYTFEKLHKDKGSLNLWSTIHMKEASRAFLKHSTKTKDIASLIFNKEDFTMNEIFPDSDVPLNSENFNPFMKVKSLSPRVEYMEYGITLGMRWDHPVCDKGRIGIRASAPFRRIEVERQDSGLDKNENPLNEFVSTKVIQINRDHAGADAAALKVDVAVTAYRMDLLANLPDAVGNRIVDGSDVGGHASFRILNNQLAVTAANAALTPVAITGQGADGKPFYNGFMLADGGNENLAIYRLEIAHITALANDYTGLPADNTAVRRFLSAATTANTTYANLVTSAVFTANAGKTWLTFRRQTDSPDAQRFGAGVSDVSGAGGAVARGIDNLLAQYNQNVFSFLAANNYSLDSNIRSGLGDTDVDLFYEHTFTNEWMGEINAGVRVPTGGDKDLYGSPYKPMLGNGQHWEVKLGAMGCYQPLSWMNMKVDGKYAFVLEGTEHRMATFAGSKVKNIGPRANCDVDWGYFVGHFDFNFFHPKDSGIRSTLGYEIYYKSEDHVTYKQKEMQSWLGGTVADPTGNKKTLDSKLARKNTESIAHKARFETSAQLLKYFEVFAGGSMTFAGQNVMRDRDAHAGFNVRF